MLELADTMIGLRLPILLVAPQKRDYSFIEDSAGYGDGQFSEDRPQPPPKAPPSAESSSTASTGGRDAMFMGLGDVIFPGMLVLSAVQYIGGTEGLLVGLTTLIGGLAGYAVLMRAVSTGRAQAGLPLLNGGSILGYLVGGLLFVGSGLFAFGISL
jgi:presenilin-like A22 family membrane protease